jgi:hypothetical protein
MRPCPSVIHRISVFIVRLSSDSELVKQEQERFRLYSKGFSYLLTYSVALQP